MLMLVSLALILVSSVHAGIDYTRCESLYGHWGETVSCKDGWVAIGLCSSGVDANCQGQSYTELLCCALTSTKNVKACDTLEGGYGSYLECASGKVVQEVCSSGRDANCGGASYNRISCCDDHDLNVSSICSWIHGHYGDRKDCPYNQVAVGVCTSGVDANCSNNYTGVKCCAINI